MYLWIAPLRFSGWILGLNPKVRVHRRNKRWDTMVDEGLVRGRGDERRRIPEAIASPLRSGKREAPPVRAICIQRPSCRERGEVAINNATHHQYLAGITARTPIQKRGREGERESRLDWCVCARRPGLKGQPTGQLHPFLHRKHIIALSAFDMTNARTKPSVNYDRSGAARPAGWIHLRRLTRSGWTTGQCLTSLFRCREHRPNRLPEIFSSEDYSSLVTVIFFLKGCHLKIVISIV